jgi:ribonuclease T1
MPTARKRLAHTKLTHSALLQRCEHCPDQSYFCQEVALAKTSTSLVRRAGLIGCLVGSLLVLGHWLPAYADSTAAPAWSEAITAAIAVAELPKEAQKTLALIKNGGPFSYEQDGNLFSNRERILPKRPRGYYREYTVPTPSATNRGVRRIIAGSNGEYFYTDDHYRTFRLIRMPS